MASTALCRVVHRKHAGPLCRQFSKHLPRSNKTLCLHSSPALLLQHHGRRDPVVTHLPAEGQTQSPATHHGEDGRRDQHAHVQRQAATREGQHDVQYWADARVSIGNRDLGGGRDMLEAGSDALSIREEGIKILVWFSFKNKAFNTTPLVAGTGTGTSEHGL